MVSIIPLPADSLLFHAGTGIRNGIIETAGGRVLCVSSYGNNIKEAVRQIQESTGADLL